MSHPEFDFDVVVAGAGMVGACVAYGLARQGRRVALIEATDSMPFAQADDEAFDLRVSAISPRSRQILEGLGIWQQLDSSRLCNYEKMFVWHQNGESSLALDAVDLVKDDLGTIVENRLIQQALHRACSSLPKVEWFQPDRVDAILEHQANWVELKLSSGRILKTGLLIAADGRNSPTRQLAQMEAQSGRYQQTAYVANVTTELPHQHTAWQRFLATGPLAFLPLANGQSSIVWSCDDSFAMQLADASDEDFCSALSEAFEFKLGQVSQCSNRLSFPLGWHHCEQWVKQRILLIGDAAHSVHPLAGQGVNLGFSDVDLLLQLTANTAVEISQSKLRRYERQRKSQTWVASNSFSGLKWVFAQDQKMLTTARDLGMRVINDIPWFRRVLMRKALENLT